MPQIPENEIALKCQELLGAHMQISMCSYLISAVVPLLRDPTDQEPPCIPNHLTLAKSILRRVSNSKLPHTRTVCKVT